VLGNRRKAGQFFHGRWGCPWDEPCRRSSGKSSENLHLSPCFLVN
jgi:hypothetical protein